MMRKEIVYPFYMYNKQSQAHFKVRKNLLKTILCTDETMFGWKV